MLSRIFCFDVMRVVDNTMVELTLVADCPDHSSTFICLVLHPPFQILADLCHALLQSQAMIKLF